MAISERTIKNKRNGSGELTGKPGTVYDVNIKYKSNGQQKTYTRKGFRTKMKQKLTNASYTPPAAAQRKEPVSVYMTDWLTRHGNVNLRPSTQASYQSHMRNHIFPYIGDVPLVEQLPFKIPAATKEISVMAPVKSSERSLPITDFVLPYFQRHLQLQNEQKKLLEMSGGIYYNNRPLAEIKAFK